MLSCSTDLVAFYRLYDFRGYSRACVRVEGQVRGEIERGLCVLVGIHHSDSIEDVKVCGSHRLSRKKAFIGMRVIFI